MVVRPGAIAPSCSAASIIATPIRSFTEPPGLSASSLAKSSTSDASGATRVSCTIGVAPTCSAMLIGTRAMAARSVARRGLASGLVHRGLQRLVGGQRIARGGDHAGRKGVRGGAGRLHEQVLHHLLDPRRAPRDRVTLLEVRSALGLGQA